jgi:glycosyltransferase involved in cell wall biosynthesis
VHGLSFADLAARFQTPQAFLASADVEGCALPPLEAMAAGIVVVGKDAQGANFYMRHGETALVANDAAHAAEALRAIEVDQAREELSRRAYAVARNWFPEGEPTAFWKRFLAESPWA